MECAIGLLKGRSQKLLYLDHLDERFSAKVIMAACVLHNLCLLHDDFDEGYFLPNDDDDDNVDSADDRTGDRAAQLKRNQFMNIVCL